MGGGINNKMCADRISQTNIVNMCVALAPSSTKIIIIEHNVFDVHSISIDRIYVYDNLTGVSSYIPVYKVSIHSTHRQIDCILWRMANHRHESCIRLFENDSIVDNSISFVTFHFFPSIYSLIVALIFRVALHRSDRELFDRGKNRKNDTASLRDSVCRPIFFLSFVCGFAFAYGIPARRGWLGRGT